MNVERLPIPGLVKVTPLQHADQRGAFSETYSRRALAPVFGDFEFVQDNQSLSAKRGTVRGLHLQLPPKAQAKLVRVLRGAIFDVAVDLRLGSPTYGCHLAVRLSAADRTQLFIPKGFAHGFCTLENDTEVSYKTDEYYSSQHDRAVLWNDPALAIAWPVKPEDAILSDRDAGAPRLNEGDWRRLDIFSQ